MRTKKKISHGIDKNENENGNENKNIFKNARKDRIPEIREEQRAIEAEYLKEMREYDTKMIQYDYDRRALRRRRQALLDKKLSLQKREKILNLISQKNCENERNFVSQNEEDATMLQKKLDVVNAEIEYQKSLLLSLTKKRMKKQKMKLVTNSNEEMTNYFLISLKQQEKDLLEKKESIDSRQLAARRILSEPIDDIRLEELLIHDIEEDAELVENQFNSINRIDDDESLIQMSAQIEELESNNLQRKKDLIARKSLIDQEMKMNSNKKIPIAKKSAASPKYIESSNSDDIRKEKVSQIINNICNSLAQRQKKLTEEEKKIDELEAQNKKKRAEIEKQWNLKVTQIKTQTSKIREIEQLNQSIKDMEVKIEEEKHSYLSICDSKKKIKRKIKIFLRDKDYNSKKNAEHQDLFSSLNKRKEELEKFDLELKKRSSDLKNQQNEIEEKEKSLLEIEQRVRDLESQVNELQKKNDSKIAQIQETTAQFEASRLAYLTKMKDVNVFTFNLETINQT